MMLFFVCNCFTKIINKSLDNIIKIKKSLKFSIYSINKVLIRNLSTYNVN